MQPYDENAVVKMVATCLSAAVDKRIEETRIPSPFPGQVGQYIDYPWPIYDEFVRGDHWKRMGRQPTWKSQPVDNFPFIVVESNTTKMTDNRPKVTFVPRNPDDYEKARITSAGFDYWWEKESCALKDTMNVKDSRKFGVGWLGLIWDDLKRQQTLRVINPENLYPDPDCTIESFYTDGPTYIIYEYLSSVADILAAYPDILMEELKPDWLTDQTSLTDRIRAFFTGSRTVKNPAQTIPVYELWIRDSEMDTWEEEFGEAIVKKRGLKYPRGRFIRCCGGKVLEDKENPYKHGHFPFVPVPCYPSSDKFYSVGDVQNLLNPAVMVNKYSQIIFDQTVKSGGGIALVNPAAGLSAEMLTNDPMQVHEVRDVARALRMEAFPSPSRHTVDHLMTLKQSEQDMAGLHDSSMGKYTPGNKTAQEVGIINESDNTRIRLAAKFHSWQLQRIGEMWLSNARQYGDFKWIVRVASEDGAETPVTFDKKTLSGIEFDVEVADFAMLPDTYQERKSQALQLMQMGVIDPEELLKTLEWPNYQQVIARMKGEAEKQQADQAQMQPPQTPPDMGGVPDMGGMPPEMMGGMPQMGGMGMPSVPEMGQMSPDDLAMIEQMAAQNGMAPEDFLMVLMGGQ